MKISLSLHQKILCPLRKEKKQADITYFEIYQPDPTLPRLDGIVKVHKPEKIYLLRIIHHLGTPAHELSNTSSK